MRYDFILAAGNASSDEDVFAMLPATAYSIRVGDGRTAARHTLDSAEGVRGLLRELAVLS
jgi:trehalose 6-phosphate synthase/phosphatase